MAVQITVLLPWADSFKEVTITASTWELDPQLPAAEPGKITLQALSLFAGSKEVASFPPGMWLGVYYTARKAPARDSGF